MKRFFLIIVAALLWQAASAQEFPYPQSQQHPYGYMSSNITTAQATAEYNDWISAYYVECSASEARIDYDGNTVSEGIGYGLVITAYAGDKTKFDKLLNYYNNRKNGNGVMNWEYPGCSLSPSGSGAATDGDMDAAMGMLVAIHQWPGQGYEQDFEALASAMKNTEFTSCNGIIIQKPGDAWGGCDCTNPSYYSPGYYRAFAAYYTEKGDNTNASWWTQAADDSYVVLFANQHSSSGLVTAWTNQNGDAGPCGGVAGGGGGPDTYQYDACRTPWRIATDYLWWGSSDAETFLLPMVNFVKTNVGGIENVVDGYNHDGSVFGQWHNVPFVGSFALAAMTTSQSDANDFLGHFSTLSGDNYFNTCLSVMYKFLATGNYWNPYGVEPGPVCSQVDLGSDVSLCGIGSVELNAGISSGTNRTFTWYRNDSQLQASTSNTYSAASQAGTYKVIMDSAGVCASEAIVEVEASIPTVNLGPDVFLSGSLTLDAGVSGTGLQYTWFKDDVEISGETQKTLAVTDVGLYRVEVSATACAMQSDEILIDRAPYISKTSASITIDGTVDNAYGTTFRDITELLSGSIGEPNLSGSWSGLWDDTHVYIVLQIVDDNLSSDSGTEWYNDDGVEVFIDADNSKNSSYDAVDDFQWGFVWNTTTVNAGGNNPGNSTAGIDFVTTSTANGYNVEIAIPWSTINLTPSIGHIMGFDVAINDDDGGGTRDNKIIWNATVDNGWQNPSLFGEVELIDEQNTTVSKTQTINLNQGWNLVSFWVQADNSSVDAVFGSLGNNLVRVKTQDKIYSPTADAAFNTLTNIEVGKGYLVYVTNSASLTVEGLPVSQLSVSLLQGWNLIGYPFETSETINTVINPINWQVSSVKNFEGIYQGNGNLTDMEAGKAYFINVNQNTVLEF
ncbi:MAG: glycosyl hydrolase family 8 [Bacteroidales bacterium]|jgi:endo-1,4-beta-D-glucanase Y|nr:glycosyl hydrolase family 8 [Bacteroidales bacterium]